MELALHDPERGYYARGPERLGPGGDFFTASDLGDLFGRCVARQALEADRLLGSPDPFAYVERGQVFLSVEPDDPAPDWLPAALGDVGRRVCGFAVDYGHWDATLENCVGLVAGRPGLDAEHKRALLSDNALRFYGPRLRRRIAATHP